VLQARVDALSVRYDLAVDPVVFDTLMSAKRDRQRTAVVRGREYVLHARGGRGQPIHLSSADLHCFVGQTNVFVADLSIHRLATVPLADNVAFCADVAASFGSVSGASVVELDLCADVACTFRESDQPSFVGRCRRAAIHSVGRRFSGFTFGSGAVKFAIYDKLLQLEQHRDPARAGLEKTIWRSSGWNDGDPAWRVEARIRAGALGDFGLRDPSGLAGKVDGVWQDLVRRSLRLTLADGTTRRQRRPIDPRWSALQSASFVRATRVPIKRIHRTIQGATLDQVVGSLISHLGPLGRLHAIDVGGRALAELLGRHFVEVICADERALASLAYRVAAARVMEAS
jgi:hypothetical protein